MSMKDNFKGTPGPWKVMISSKGILQIAKSWPHPEYPNDSSVCLIKQVCPIVEFLNATYEHKANAALIAAAPEMLEAMQEFVDRVEKGEVRSVKTYAKFKSIIAKATTI